jgi:hypothetical protein
MPHADYLPTWHALRTDASHTAAFAAQYPDATDRVHQTQAAEKTAVHATTPTVTYADTLGRTFLTVAHNRSQFDDTPGVDEPVEEFHRTRIILDIEGNQREIIDAQDRVVMRYDYDMLRNRIHQLSMEAGARWMLGDVTGKPIGLGTASATASAPGTTRCADPCGSSSAAPTLATPTTRCWSNGSSTGNNTRKPSCTTYTDDSTSIWIKRAPLAPRSTTSRATQFAHPGALRSSTRKSSAGAP